MIERVHPPRNAGGNGLPGFEVVPDSLGRMVGPFALLASIGPADLPAGIPMDADVRPHPHIGMGVLAYLKSGEISHRDDLGNFHRLGAGEITWMLAGRGIVHSERLDTLREQGGRVQGLIAFLALPEEAEQAAPECKHVESGDIPIIRSPGATGRLLLGSVEGAHSLVQPASPAYAIHWTLEPGGFLFPQAAQPERAIHVVAGEVDYGGQTFARGSLVTLISGAAGWFRATAPTELIEFGGAPVGPRYKWWNFLSSSLDRIEAAKEAWRQDSRPLPPGETEFIPLPADEDRPLQLLHPGASVSSASDGEPPALCA